MYETVTLEKGLYTGGEFARKLEALDPFEGYRGTPMEGLDAFQRQLKRFDIKVRGAQSDRVEKFFQNAQSAVLFPEFVARCVRQGLEEGSILPKITAAVTQSPSPDYRSLTATSAAASGLFEADKTAEGAALPETKITTQSGLVPVSKRGRLVSASYESLRYQKIDMLALVLRQIGSHIARAQVKDAVSVLTAAGCGASTMTGTAPAYADLLSFFSDFSPFELNTLIVNKAEFLAILKLAELQNPLTGLNFQGTGQLTTPLGANFIRCDDLPAGTILGIDRRYALEVVQCGDVTVDVDKLISTQFEQAAVSVTTGFSRIFSGAVRTLKKV